MKALAVETNVDSAPAQATKLEKTPEREQALGRVLIHIERNFGQGSIMRLGEAKKMKVKTIPIGALPLDVALGGELPKGRVIRNLWARKCGKNDASAACDRQRSGARRHRCFYRCRARSRAHLCQSSGRRRSKPNCLSAR